MPRRRRIRPTTRQLVRIARRRQGDFNYRYDYPKNTLEGQLERNQFALGGMIPLATIGASLLTFNPLAIGAAVAAATATSATVNGTIAKNAATKEQQREAAWAEKEARRISREEAREQREQEREAKWAAAEVKEKERMAKQKAKWAAEEQKEKARQAKARAKELAEEQKEKRKQQVARAKKLAKTKGVPYQEILAKWDAHQEKFAN